MNRYFDLYLKYAPGRKAAAEIYHHTTIVLVIAKQIAEEKKLKVNWQVAEPGILLHDIAVFECEEMYQPKVVKPYIQHALLGAMIVRAESFPDKVAKMVERHIGLGISKEEIEENDYPLPRRNFIPETLEEKLHCYSDKFHSKEKGFCTFQQRLKQYRKYGEGPVERLKRYKDEFGIPDISRIKKEYQQQSFR